MVSPDENPYAAPLSYERGDALTDYYKIDLRRPHFRELWRLVESPIPFLVLSVRKLLRLPSGRTAINAIRRPATLQILKHDDVPPEVWDAWSEGLQTCREQGLTLSFLHSLPSIGAGNSNYQASLLSADEMVSATCVYVRVRRGRIDRVVSGHAVSSMLADGRYANTMGVPQAFTRPSNVSVKRLTGASMSRLLEAHRARISTFDQPIVRMERAGHYDRVLKAHQELFDEMVRRGVYVPLTEKEYESLIRPPAPPDTPAPAPESSTLRRIRQISSWNLLVALVVLIVGEVRRSATLITIALVLFGFGWVLAVVVSLLRKRRVRS